MKKDELITLRFKTKEELDEALSILHRNSKIEILPVSDTGYYVKVSKFSAIKLEQSLNK